MKRFVLLGAPLVLLAAVALRWTPRPLDSAETPPVMARGHVFHDVNGNGLRDEGESPIPDVRVSNGRQIVKTNADGAWELPIDTDDIVFVIKPSGWRTPLSETMLPRFYYIHKPNGSPPLKFAGVKPTGPLPESIDFPLYQQHEPEKFKAVLFGDPQPRDQKEVDYIAHDVVEDLIGTDASFGVTLGDIVFDDLSMFEPQARAIGLIGIPWYNVIGNHDINYDASHDHHSDETFERHFGPAYYSFDYGQAHFLVLDDIEWIVPNGVGKGRYQAGLGNEQMEFIRNDLALIPENQMVVLMMHIPLVDVRDRHELYRLIEQRPFCISISGHTHHHEHRIITREDGWMGPEPHHHIINVTVSGSWWSGAPDERGIPHTTMADGAPNGYSIITFDGNEYTLDFHAAGRPADWQMHIHAPEVITSDQSGETDVFVNVFNGSERSKVAMRMGSGDWAELERRVTTDPAYVQLFEAEQKITNKTWRDLPKPKSSTHLWQGKLPAELAPGLHLIEVRTVDMHGREFVDRRSIRVE
ncbi:MAG: calcineurin-like phosphoesterase family protein [Planctomycetales bacterium]|nr:calcineurin-like phosphoesterase family protein [Planctomycetales bacterium]